MAIELVYLILSTWVEEMSGDTVPDNNKKFSFRKLILKIQIEKKKWTNHAEDFSWNHLIFHHPLKG